MTVEFARTRINKIRNDMNCSLKNLNNKLGINNKEDSQASLYQVEYWLVR